MTQTKGRTTARLATRAEEAPRMPESGPVPAEARDPNKIYTRSGREVGRLQYTGNEDKFAFDRSIIPSGWTYEWKTRTVKNWEWIDHQVELAANGWEPVPAERHPGVFMPAGYTGNIERGGMVLMERDERLTAQARAADRRSANEQLKVSRSMAGLMERAAPNSGAVMDMSHPEAQRVSGVKVERQARVADSKYNYTVDE